MKAYAFFRGLGILAFAGGCLALIESIGNNFWTDSSEQLLLIGVSAIGFGIVVGVLGDLGGRVIRIQEKLGALSAEDRLFRDDT